jgi:hypothetical protein
MNTLNIIGVVCAAASFFTGAYILSVLVIVLVVWFNDKKQDER